MDITIRIDKSERDYLHLSISRGTEVKATVVVSLKRDGWYVRSVKGRGILHQQILQTALWELESNQKYRDAVELMSKSDTLYVSTKERGEESCKK
ncbi:MAG: hypothetical protein GF411_01005 [Candidatus Lokiarchaeota archaeon]|nr:hypothetical protein [Candidatus Lokiarchaeota archaeon]